MRRDEEIPEKKRAIVFSEATAINLLKLYDEGWEKDKEVSYNPDGPENMKVYYLTRLSEDELIQQSMLSPEKLKDFVIDSVSVPIDKHTDREKDEATPYQAYMKKGYREGHKTSSAVVMELTEKTTGNYVVDFIIRFSKENKLDQSKVMGALTAGVKAGALPLEAPEMAEKVIEGEPQVFEGHSGEPMEMIKVTVTDEQVEEEEKKRSAPPKETPLVYKKATGEAVKTVTADDTEELPLTEFNEKELGCVTCTKKGTCTDRVRPIHYMTLKENSLHMCAMHQDYDKTKPKEKAKAKPKEEPEVEPETPHGKVSEDYLGCEYCNKECNDEQKQAYWDKMNASNGFGCEGWAEKK